MLSFQPTTTTLRFPAVCAERYGTVTEVPNDGTAEFCWTKVGTAQVPPLSDGGGATASASTAGAASASGAAAASASAFPCPASTVSTPTSAELVSAASLPLSAL